MRKIGFYLFLFWFLNTNAQDKVGLIFKGGITLAKTHQSGLFSNYALNEESKLGYCLGASYEIPISRSLFIESGLFFQQTSSKATIAENGYWVRLFNNEKKAHKEVVTFQKLTLPILLKTRLEFKRMNFFISLGVYSETSLGGNIDSEFSSANKNSYEIKAFSDYEIGLQNEIGFEFNNFVIGTRTSSGFYNVEYRQKSYLVVLYIGFML